MKGNNNVMSCSGLTRASFVTRAFCAALLIVAVALMFASCEGLGSDVQPIAPQFFAPQSFAGTESEAQTGTAYVTLGSVRAIDGGISRTVLPEAAAPESFGDLKLFLIDATTGTQTELASAATLAELSSKMIEVAVGPKTFRLTAKRGGANFSGDATATLVKGQTT